MDITKLSELELNGLIFKEISRLQIVQSNIKVLYAELAKRNQKPLKKSPKNDKHPKRKRLRAN